MSEIEKSPARARSGAFSLGGDRRVGACASGDELVSLGFRVGNPSAIGWHQRRIFQHPCYPRASPRQRAEESRRAICPESSMGWMSAAYHCHE